MLSIPWKKFPSIMLEKRSSKWCYPTVRRNDQNICQQNKRKKEGIFFTQVVHKRLFSWIMISLAFVSIFKFETNVICWGFLLFYIVILHIIFDNNFVFFLILQAPKCYKFQAPKLEYTSVQKAMHPFGRGGRDEVIKQKLPAFPLHTTKYLLSYFTSQKWQDFPLVMFLTEIYV